MSSLSPDNLKRAILEVIVYFDLFAYPLTTLEAWRNIGQKASFQEVRSVLETSVWINERIKCQSGMWGLRGRAGERAVRYRASKHKLDIARRFARLARRIPYVEGIYACNSLGFLQARSASDIDLFIVSRRGRIWSARFFSVLVAKLFFSRPSGARARDALCLSFFAVDGADLQKVALPGGDVYYEYWLKNLLPLWERVKKVKKVQMEKRNIIEKVLRWVQLWIMPEHLKAMANKGTSVVMSDEFLKFHDNDRREYYRQQFRQRFAAVA